jgi:hypothetical protein
MKPCDTFQGTPWDTEPTEDWSQPSYWADHYPELLAEQNPDGLTGFVIVPVLM